MDLATSPFRQFVFSLITPVAFHASGVFARSVEFDDIPLATVSDFGVALASAPAPVSQLFRQSGAPNPPIASIVTEESLLQPLNISL